MTIQQANEFFAALPQFPADPQELQDILAQLNCPLGSVQFIPVTGSAGKTAIASMAAAVLQQAGFTVGRYALGDQPLRQRIWINGSLADGRAYASAAAKLSHCEEPDQACAELACAAALFEKAGCDFALVELDQPLLAQALPRLAACVVAAVGPDGTGTPVEELAAAAAGTFRKEIPAVTLPGQPKPVVQELIVAAGTAGCPLTVPDENDFTPQKHRRLQNLVDYGGYQVLLPTAGQQMARNAAAVVELALALWRTGIAIEDEAILAGLPQADVHSGVRVLRHHPLTILDPSHTPVQAAALTAALKDAGLDSLSVIVGLSDADDPDAFFAALESGAVRTAPETEKDQLAGMGENPFERVYLVTPAHPDGMDAWLAEDAARYHFDAVACESLRDAIAQARADENEGVVLCGGAAFLRQAEALLK